MLGAGGVLGGCWTLGALRVLRDHLEWEPGEADVVIGTSAGAVLAPLLASRVPVEDLIAHQHEQPTDGRLAGTSLDHDRVLPPRLPDVSGLLGSPELLWRSLRHPLSHSPLAVLAALCPCGTSSFLPVRTFLDVVLADGAWPPTCRLVATDYDTGERQVFGGDDGVDVLDAVAASCAVPGCFPPVAVGDRRFVDGSVVSLTSAELLAPFELEEIYVLAPMGARSFDVPGSALTWLERGVRVLANQALQREVSVLREAGARVTVLAPCAEDLAVMGVNMMDPSRRISVLDTVQETARGLLGA